jgi:ParB-like chromosome segregation protein Spo0J
MEMPPLTAEERAGLVESIRQHGIQYPVLVDSAGQIIDGNNRKAIAAELGIDCPTVTLAIDSSAADYLRISLNVDRRQIGPERRKVLVTELHRSGLNQHEIARTLSIAQSTVSKDLTSGSVYSTEYTDPGPQTIRGRDGKQYPRHSKKPRSDAAKRKQADRQRQADRRATERRIKAEDAVRLENSARNAPPGKLNLPALRMARDINAQMLKLADLVEPDVFVSQIPIEACREFMTRCHLLWWDKVSDLATDRLAVEAPDLPPLPGEQR